MAVLPRSRARLQRLHVADLATSTSLAHGEAVGPTAAVQCEHEDNTLLTTNNKRPPHKQHDNTRRLTTAHDSSRQLTTAHDDTRRHTTTHDNTRQHTTTHDNTRQHTTTHDRHNIQTQHNNTQHTTITESNWRERAIQKHSEGDGMREAAIANPSSSRNNASGESPQRDGSRAANHNAQRWRALAREQSGRVPSGAAGECALANGDAAAVGDATRCGFECDVSFFF